MTRANRMKKLDELACLVEPLSTKGAQLILECESDLEKLEKIEKLINEPYNRLIGSVSIKAIREVLNG